MTVTKSQQDMLDKIRQAGSVGIPTSHTKPEDLAPLVRAGDVIIIFGTAYAEDPRPFTPQDAA